MRNRRGLGVGIISSIYFLINELLTQMQQILLQLKAAFVLSSFFGVLAAVVYSACWALSILISEE